ncbi:dihydrofolate reductase [Pedobacter yulinensis]|uniref:Dihydrofolate reductase n=1 Tax=Pedobacter yulinensis TaxID=2126353 RepID=A0A2T3HL45_9SPHI|nr:dihydrofolate reductase family protein [Pedobacter yulinensis]PST83167.1 dihydrofolate reductase [Pedobacter yulinensis]
MRKLVLFAHLSLDGFAGDAKGGLGFLSYDHELQQFADEVVGTVGAALYGKNTYHLMEAYWPGVFNDPNADQHALAHARWVQDIPKIVFSTTLTAAHWQNTRLISGDIAPEVRKLKEAEGKDLVVFGSPGLAKSLLALGLIDEFKLTLHPVILGGGISLFEKASQLNSLVLLKSQTLGSGVVTLHYTKR